MSLDERAALEDLASARFADGVERGKWRVVAQLIWPYAVIAVSAASRPNSPTEFHFRVDFDRYRERGPSFAPWDSARSSVLSLTMRPKGGYLDQIFRQTWGDLDALYVPWDGLTLERKQEWRNKYPDQIWSQRTDLAWALQRLYDVLHRSDYAGVSAMS